ncbi:MAG: hypothetical protein P8169_00160 [Chloroflexota bacterium]
MKLPKFLVGLLIGGLIGSMYWYYQKSTSAEDGALQLLDRLAASDARVRDLGRSRALAPLISGGWAQQAYPVSPAWRL